MDKKNDKNRSARAEALKFQVVLRAIKFQENDSVSFYGTIRYIMRLWFQTQYMETPYGLVTGQGKSSGDFG